MDWIRQCCHCGDELRSRYVSCSLKFFKRFGFSFWVAAAGLCGMTASALFLTAFINEANQDWEFAATLVEYSLPFIFLSLFIPMSHASLYDNAIANRTSLLILSVIISFSITFITMNGVRKYRNGWENPHNVIGERYDTIANFLGSNLTLAIYIEIARLGDISIYGDNQPCQYSRENLFDVQYGRMFSFDTSELLKGDFKFRTSEAEKTPYGREFNAEIPAEGAITEDTYISWNSEARIWGNSSATCNQMYYMILFTLPSDIFSKDRCIAPFENNRLCVWLYTIRFVIQSEFLDLLRDGTPNMPSRIIRVTVLNKLPDDSIFLQEDLWNKGNGNVHFFKHLNDRHKEQENLDYATTSALIGRNETDVINYRVSFQETGDIHGDQDRWFQLEVTPRNEHQEYSQQDLEYLTTQNNLDISLEVAGQANGEILINTSVTTRSFDFSDLVTYLASIGSSLFALFGFFFPNTLPKRYNAFYPTSKKFAQKELNKVDRRLEEDCTVDNIDKGTVVMSKIPTNASASQKHSTIILERMSTSRMTDFGSSYLHHTPYDTNIGGSVFQAYDSTGKYDERKL